MIPGFHNLEMPHGLDWTASVAAGLAVLFVMTLIAIVVLA